MNLRSLGRLFAISGVRGLLDDHLGPAEPAFWSQPWRKKEFDGALRKHKAEKACCVIVRD